MSQWQSLQRLDSALQGRVIQLYERKLPREIRHYLCVCIESQDWDSAAVDENKAHTCFHELLVNVEELRNRSILENNILQGPDFAGMKDYLLEHFEGEPVKLALILSETLKEENKILASASEAQGLPAVDQKWKELDNKVNEVTRLTSEMKKEMNSLQFLNENLDFIQKSWKRNVEQNNRLAQTQAFVEEECQKRTNFITQTKQMVLQQIVNILNLAQHIVVTLTDMELPEWKRRQQMACIGSPADTRLDDLQKWFTAVADVLLQVRGQLQKLQDQDNKYNSPEASSSMADIEKFTVMLFTKLLTNALVVEKQPIMSSLPQRPLILKTKVRFTMTVRFLANLPEFKCLLKVKPVFDKDVEEAKTVKGFRRFDINEDDCKVLDVDSAHGGLVGEFAHMSIKESKSRSKGSNESHLVVTEELHIIKFVTRFHHNGLKFNIEATSLPVVVVSSSNQVVSAWASIMWCNVLSTSEPRNLSLFVDPAPLSWQQLAQVLSWQFLSVGERELDENQLSMLRDKLVENPEGLVHWTKFSKSENAWIWIDGILDLIKKHLLDLWRDGSIMGFVSRDRTEILLQEKRTGTFLLRFSESNKEGAITFSWVDHSNGETHVHAVEPYTKTELCSLSLPNIIYQYNLRAQRNKHKNPLIYLYPDIHKDAAFGRYYNTSQLLAKKDLSGYVIRKVMHISENPTPPASPPRDTSIMDMANTDIDMDMDLDTGLDADQLQDLYDLLDVPEYRELLNNGPLYQVTGATLLNLVALSENDDDEQSFTATATKTMQNSKQSLL